ncbi:urease accessory protein UreF [Methylovirgula sp. 4M-Z18]|uniref:urease accessory protein UreF n=1 Tax=Methylovirgula sp. 4M-Z18 TaxID=2293567 RepID=UPI000E2ECECC|nr:urease accessory UreF family protein [Methylovirgula sp. 4M-Z18]RFB79198.1 urease accessory protein UreF [Methylovirgula sp. 4M-Z18]
MEGETEQGRAALHELPLFLWLSPAFPVGAFAYSHAIEWAVECGDIADGVTLENWLKDLLEHGAPHNDCILFAQAWRFVRDGGDAELRELNDLAIALSPSRERHLETIAQGNAFLSAVRAAWPCKALQDLAFDGDVAYPVAVAVAAAGHGFALRVSLEAFALALIANLVSAAVRLGPLGQSEGQRILRALTPHCRALADFAEAATLDDLGGAAFRSDIASLKHETQYSRLFRS